MDKQQKDLEDAELELMEKFLPLEEEPIEVLEVMKRDKEAHIHQEFFDKAEGKEKERIGRLMLYRFGIDLANN